MLGIKTETKLSAVTVADDVRECNVCNLLRSERIDSLLVAERVDARDEVCAGTLDLTNVRIILFDAKDEVVAVLPSTVLPKPRPEIVPKNIEVTFEYNRGNMEAIDSGRYRRPSLQLKMTSSDTLKSVLIMDMKTFQERLAAVTVQCNPSPLRETEASVSGKLDDNIDFEDTCAHDDLAPDRLP